jgi:hypothetical protein
MDNELTWETEHPIASILAVSPDLRDVRIQICTACDSLTVLKTCKECGCFMPVKTWMNNVSCPKGEW